MNISIRKKLAVSFFVLIFSVPVFSQKVTFFTFAPPDVTSSFSIALPVIPELCTDTVIAENYVSADFKELFLDCGVAFQADRLDYTGRVFYMPTIHLKNTYQIGLGLNHHYLRYYNIFTENDLVVSARFRWYKNDFFDFEAATGVMWKISTIDVLKHLDLDPVVNYCFLASLLFNLNFTPTFKVYFDFSTLDFFEYPLFSSPILKSGFCYKFDKHLGLDMSVALKFYDMIVSAVMLNQCTVRTTLKVFY